MKRRVWFVMMFLCLLVGCQQASFLPTPTPTFARLGGVDLDVTYCTMDDQPLKMDVYNPASGGPWPVLMYVHGGGWQSGDKSDGRDWRRFTDDGFLVVSVDYRVYPAYKFPAMIEDLKCAVRHLRAHAGEYNLDPQHIAAIGHSAGGHLVALLGTSDESAGWDVGEYLDQSSRVQAVVDLAGPADFTREFPEFMISQIYVVFGGWPNTTDPETLAASPVTYVTPDDPPFLILHGDRDEAVPLEQGRAMHAALAEAGVPSSLVIVANGDHSLQDADGLPASPTWEQIDRLIVEFLEKSLK